MLTNWLILDVASAPLPDTDKYLEGTIRAPKNYKNDAKIQEYIAEMQAERVAMAATDIDLARITGVSVRAGSWTESADLVLRDHREQHMLEEIAGFLDAGYHHIITFGGFDFDLPLLMRRARYLNVPFPVINLDRYKSPHVDLKLLLSDRNPSRMRSLDFYTRRLGWTDLWPKPLSGADEARVPVTGQWDLLADSLRRDVEATYRLAVWAGVIEPAKAMDAVQLEVGF